jgi:hypothetical protein
MCCIKLYCAIFKSNNINFGEGEIRNLLGDPETLSTLIGAMDEVTAGTPVGWSRAHQLANKENLSISTIKRE